MKTATGYENSPSARLVATNCACCGRALCDAASVEAGIGPDCRKKYGYGIEVAEAARERANHLVYQIAVEQVGLTVAQAAAELRDLGFAKLAAIVEKRACKIRLREGEHEGRQGFFVTAPYSERATWAFRQIRGRRWVAESKENFIPLDGRAVLWSLLASCYPGEIACGGKGPFVV